MYNYILNYLPYKSSFLFIDNITSLDENGVTGDYTLKGDSFFYEDHFPGNPVTPGAILTEIMAQIGLVVLGIFLVTAEPAKVVHARPAESPTPIFPLLTSAEVSFLKMVLPGQKVTVVSDKVYFRFDKL